MANSAGFLQESIWRDPEFRALPRTAQTLYAQLVSQKELDRAGILPLHVAKWAKGCDEMTEDDVWRDLGVLQERRFVFYDVDTDEALVRSYMRRSNVVKQPNLMKNALRCAGMVASERLRHELAVELLRLQRSDAAQVAADIEPFGNPSGSLAEPFENPSETLNPSRTLREPRGEGEGVGEGTTSLLVEVRDARAKSNGRSLPREPSQNCERHPTGTTTPCGGCKQAREAHSAWQRETLRTESAARSAEARARATIRAQAIAACGMCDGDGYAHGSLCDHDTDTTARAERGRALVEAALRKEPDA